MITDANRKKRGQSMLEFALLLPLILLVFKIMIETQSAMNTAIVNQKYARGSMHFLFFNHRNYPELKFAQDSDGKTHRRHWVGISDNILFGLPSDQLIPKAPERSIGGLSKGPPIDEPPQTEYEEIAERQRVRIRVTSFTCIPPLAVNGTQLLTESNLQEGAFIGNAYTYCSSSL